MLVRPLPVTTFRLTRRLAGTTRSITGYQQQSTAALKDGKRRHTKRF
jgi:hypothetical protein